MMFRNLLLFSVICVLIAFSVPAKAAGSADDLERLLDGRADAAPAAVAPQARNDDASLKDNTPLRLTSNKDMIVRLDRDAASVIVNNPDHASVMLDSPRLLIVMPRLPGMTSFSVLDGRGDVILYKNIIVSNVQSQYVRIRRMCDGSFSGCVPAAYYYCPDGCYEVTPVKPAKSGTIPPPVGGGSASNNAASDAASSGDIPSAADILKVLQDSVKTGTSGDAGGNNSAGSILSIPGKF